MLKLRCARPEETGAVCAFYNEVIEGLAGAQYSPDWAKDIYPDRTMLEGYVQRGEMYTGEAAGRLACAVVIDEADACVGIHLLAVHPDFRGMGLGREMVAFAIEAARKRGAEKICLDVTEGNLPAERLYASMGFGFVQSRRDWFTDEDYMDFREYEYRV